MKSALGLIRNQLGRPRDYLALVRSIDAIDTVLLCVVLDHLLSVPYTHNSHQHSITSDAHARRVQETVSHPTFVHPL